MLNNYLLKYLEARFNDSRVQAIRPIIKIGAISFLIYIAGPAKKAI
jgi:hypothetical protein